VNFEKLKQRVERREMLADGRASQTRMAYATLRETWREAWTPGRIVIAGLLAGFVAGRSQPAQVIRRVGAIGGPQWIRTVSTLSGLFASLQSLVAAVTAKGAAETADDAAHDAAEAADVAAETAGDAAQDAGAAATAPQDPRMTAPTVGPMPPSDRRRRVDPAWDAPPRAAEAATDVSER